MVDLKRKKDISLYFGQVKQKLGILSESEKINLITWLELKAAFLALKAFTFG